MKLPRHSGCLVAQRWSGPGAECCCKCTSSECSDGTPFKGIGLGSVAASLILPGEVGEQHFEG